MYILVSAHKQKRHILRQDRIRGQFCMNLSLFFYTDQPQAVPAGNIQFPDGLLHPVCRDSHFIQGAVNSQGGIIQDLFGCITDGGPLRQLSLRIYHPVGPDTQKKLFLNIPRGS